MIMDTAKEVLSGVLPGRRKSSMSDLPKPTSGTLHAMLREIEPGLYHANYSGEINPETRPSGKFLTSTSAPTPPASGCGSRKWPAASATKKSCGIPRSIETRELLTVAAVRPPP
jgi:hypothetical protein